MRILLLLIFLVSQSVTAQTVFFRESFDDPNFTQRGWYDNATIPTTASEFHGTGGRAAEYIYRKGGTKAQGSAIRRQFTPSRSVYVSYWVKYSANFVGSGKPYHPHEFHFTTTLNDKYVGPAWTKMTLYIEQNNGYPMLAFQDGENIDTANIKKRLIYYHRSPILRRMQWYERRIPGRRLLQIRLLLVQRESMEIPHTHFWRIGRVQQKRVAFCGGIFQA